MTIIQDEARVFPNKLRQYLGKVLLVGMADEDLLLFKPTEVGIDFVAGEAVMHGIYKDEMVMKLSHFVCFTPGTDAQIKEFAAAQMESESNFVGEFGDRA